MKKEMTFALLLSLAAGVVIAVVAFAGCSSDDAGLSAPAPAAVVGPAGSTATATASACGATAAASAAGGTATAAVEIACSPDAGAPPDAGPDALPDLAPGECIAIPLEGRLICP
jgi:hypothetical protein